MADLRGNQWSLGEPRERLTLVGEHIRAKRAARGLELADVERVLKIKRRTLLAIEVGELEGFTNQSVIPGHVRSYARYLGIDPERTYRRFCHETGFSSPSALVAAAEVRTAGGRRVAFNNRAGTDLATSRFAVRSGGPALPARFPAGAIVAIALAVIVTAAALIYGADQVLRSVQQTGLTHVGAPSAAQHAGWHPQLRSRAELLQASALRGGTLALLYERPPDDVPSRDGPISALDPEVSGLFSSRAVARSGGSNGGGAPAELTRAETPLDLAPSGGRLASSRPGRELVLAQNAATPAIGGRFSKKEAGEPAAPTMVSGGASRAGGSSATKNAPRSWRAIICGQIVVECEPALRDRL